MIAYRLDTENQQVFAYRTRREAGSKGNNLPIVDSAEAIAAHDSLSTNDIRAIFNKLTNANVKKFATRSTAARRLWDALRAIEPNEAPEVPKTVENERTTKEAGQAPVSTKGRKPGSGKFEGKFIFPLKETNPRRAGTFGFKSFEIIKGRIEGVPYAEYLERGGRAKDLQWDIDKKFAEVKENASK
jgi:hypothetical protein